MPAKALTGGDGMIMALQSRVAVVDDSPEVVDLLREILQEAGYDVLGFSGDADDLVSDLATANPDAVILDLLFGGPTSRLSGWDYVRLMRSHKILRRVPILVCTGDVIALRDRHEEIDRDPFLVAVEKPFSLDQLEGAVSRLIGAATLPEWDDERDLVLVADHEARLVHASAAMLSVLGLDAADLEVSRVSDIVAEGPAWTDREWERYLSERAWEGPVALRTRSGEVLPATARADIIEGPSSTWHVSRIRVHHGSGQSLSTAGSTA